MARDVVIVSNRGPISFGRDAAGALISTKTGGGLASALRPLLGDTTQWVSFAMSDNDRRAASSGTLETYAPGAHLVVIDEHTYDLAYNGIANEQLWFAHHGLPIEEHDGDDRAWQAFETYNEVMAVAVANLAPRNAYVLIQDYHLCLVAATLRELRPDVRLVHFSHTPFVGPGEPFLPEPQATAIMTSMAANDACGFHSRRWADAMTQTSIEFGVKAAPTFVSPLAPDVAALRSIAASSECVRQLHAIEAMASDRLVIARVDRIEPSKNIEAGFKAYEQLLTARQDLIGEVVFLAYVYPSRESIERYRVLKASIIDQAAAINERFTDGDWNPIVLDTSDNLTGAVAALRRYDVLLVNPTRDGLNLVAMEGPLVNERDGQVVLSAEAGASEVLGDAATRIDPSDIDATMAALAETLDSGLEERQSRSGKLRDLASANTPQTWLAAQLRN